MRSSPETQPLGFVLGANLHVVGNSGLLMHQLEMDQCEQAPPVKGALTEMEEVLKLFPAHGNL